MLILQLAAIGRVRYGSRTRRGSDVAVGSNPVFLRGRARRVQTFVQEGRQLAKLLNAAADG
jgi:hypothetical protein